MSNCNTDKFNKLNMTLYCRGLFCDKKENCLRFALNKNAIYPENPANCLCGDWIEENYRFFEPIPQVDTRDKNITFCGRFCENGLFTKQRSTVDNVELSTSEFVYTKTEEFCKDIAFNILFHLDQMNYDHFKRNRVGNFTIDIKIKNTADNLIKDLENEKDKSTRKVTYTVDFDCEVSDEVYEALECMQEEFPCGMNDDDILSSDIASAAFEWLNNKCKENDAMSWSFEIEDLTEL